MKLRQKVYKTVSKIPQGKVSTYGDVGRFLGTKAYRAIGQILHKNPSWPKVPCHRIVMKDGSLAPNYGLGGPNIQRQRLEAEGVKFIGEKVDMENYKVEKVA